MAYQYQRSLGSHELRLLTPVSISYDALYFRIQEVRRDSNPSYAAVSYTWGNQEATKVIYLNNRRFPVRPNLWSCLYHLSRFAENEGPTGLWVDAICINQADGAERNAQVRAMDETYRRASVVSVWLGLVPSAYEYQPDPGTKTLETDYLDWDVYMTDLANRPYWSRFWVIQEFLLGQNVRLHCSNHTLGWDMFQELLCRAADVPSFSSEYDGSSTNGFLALPLVMGRHPDKHPEFYQPLDTLLTNHHRFDCKDPRDRIFSLLGLVTPEERTLLARFFPDYTLTEDQVRIIALAHITQYGPLVSRFPVPRTTISITEELYVGLGIESGRHLARLQRLAKEMDYIGASSIQELLNVLSLRNTDAGLGDLDEEDDNPDLERHGGTLQRQSWTVWILSKLAEFIGVVLIIVGLKRLSAFLAA